MKKMQLPYFICLVILFSANHADRKQTQLVTKLHTRVLTQGLQFPWEILWGPDSMIWMTERGGKISKVNTLTGRTELIMKIDEVTSQGEGGLLGMALHPQFKTHPFVFVAYNYNNSAGNYKEKI